MAGARTFAGLGTGVERLGDRLVEREAAALAAGALASASPIAAPHGTRDGAIAYATMLPP